jgi:hypothetical protein
MRAETKKHQENYLNRIKLWRSCKLYWSDEEKSGAKVRGVGSASKGGGGSGRVSYN